jgi:hypothetical protein
MRATPESIPEVLDVALVRGATSDGAPDLLIEIPHGATETADFERLAAQLASPLPEGLVDFFHVNTDTGAPELARAIAAELTAVEPARAVLILRCRVPRTFIDCNRVIDASPEEFKAGGVAPGLMPWVVVPEDKALLRARYDAYVAAVRQAALALPEHGAVLLMHTYAPRTVGVDVDLDIVKSLHRAYQPDLVTTWPERPEMDIIARGPDGVVYAPAEVVAALGHELDELGMRLGMSDTYPLHPSTLGWEHVTRRPGRGLCLEVRRDLFVERFEPFAEAQIDPVRVARLAATVTRALRTWWSA